MLINLEFTSGTKLQINLPADLETQALFYYGSGENPEQLTAQTVLNLIIADLGNKAAQTAYSEIELIKDSLSITEVE